MHKSRPYKNFEESRQLIAKVADIIVVWSWKIQDGDMKEESDMHSVNFYEQDYDLGSKCPESFFSISLAEGLGAMEIDFSANPNLLLEIEEFRNVVGLDSAVQAGFLINHDHSCWLTNLGRNGSTEVYRPANKIHRKLTHNMVAYLRHGDFVGFYGAFYRVEFKAATLSLVPVDFTVQSRFQ